MVQQQAIELVRKYIQNLNNYGLNINKAFIYGSYARNEANESSDIDVMLISDLFDTDDDSILSKPWSSKLRPDFKIEPLAIGTNRFKDDVVTPIIQIVKQEGIELRV